MQSFSEHRIEEKRKESLWRTKWRWDLSAWMVMHSLPWAWHWPCKSCSQTTRWNARQIPYTWVNHWSARPWVPPLASVRPQRRWRRHKRSSSKHWHWIWQAGAMPSSAPCGRPRQATSNRLEGACQGCMVSATTDCHAGNGSHCHKCGMVCPGGVRRAGGPNPFTSLQGVASTHTLHVSKWQGLDMRALVHQTRGGSPHFAGQEHKHLQEWGS